MPPEPTPVNPTPTPESYELLPNGKKLGWKVANRIVDAAGENWGKIASFGIGTVFAVVLLNALLGSWEKNDEVQRETAKDNAASIKSIASSMSVMAVNDEKRTLLAESTKAMQAQMLSEMRKTSELAAKHHEENLVATGRVEVAVKQNGVKIDEASKTEVKDRERFWPSATKKLEAMATSDERREKIQLGILDETKKRTTAEEKHAEEVHKALKK